MRERNLIAALTATAVVVFIPGCSAPATDPAPVFDEVHRGVSRRTGTSIAWPRDRESRQAVDEKVDELLSGEVTIEECVLIALLNNHRLRAEYETLGIAQADVVQSQMLKNPVFDLSLRYVEGHGDDYILEIGLIQDVIDVFMIPLRKRLSKAELEVAKSRVVAAVLDISARVEKAYVSLQSSEHALRLNRQILGASEASYDAATRLHDAGNITDLALANERSLYEQGKLAVASYETRVFELREELNALLGLWGEDTEWDIAETLREIPDKPFDFSELERRVLENSLDLKIVRERMVVTASRMGIETSELIFPELAGGAEAEREPDGKWSAGPAIGIGIPVFDFGQARKAAGHARLRSLWETYTAMAVELRSAARAARYRLENARRQRRYYRAVMVPLAEEITAETQLQYNAMQLGVFQLLSAKQREIDFRHQAIRALENYWVARLDIELLLNGRMIENTAVSGLALDSMQAGRREGGH